MYYSEWVIVNVLTDALVTMCVTWNFDIDANSMYSKKTSKKPWQKQSLAESDQSQLELFSHDQDFSAIS